VFIKAQAYLTNFSGRVYRDSISFEKYRLKKIQISISGATVSLQQGQKIMQTTTTDKKGNYSFKSVPSGAYDVLITKANYKSTWQKIMLKNSLVNKADFCLSLLDWPMYQ